MLTPSCYSFHREIQGETYILDSDELIFFEYISLLHVDQISQVRSVKSLDCFLPLSAAVHDNFRVVNVRRS